jgi:hypothetical protein
MKVSLSGFFSRSSDAGFLFCAHVSQHANLCSYLVHELFWRLERGSAMVFGQRDTNQQVIIDAVEDESEDATQVLQPYNGINEAVSLIRQEPIPRNRQGWPPF